MPSLEEAVRYLQELKQEVATLRKQVKDAADRKAISDRDQEYNLDVMGAQDAWQTSEEDNVDGSNGLLTDIYIPPNGKTRHIQQVVARIRLKAFRSYSAVTDSSIILTSGPSSASSSSSGGSTVGTVVGHEITDYGTVSAAGFVKDDSNTAAHGHGITDGTVLAVDGGGTATFSTYAGDTHHHDNYEHGHTVDLPNHAHPIPHDHEVPAHTHPITGAITLGATASDCTILINGTNRTVALTGAATFNVDQDELDVTQYMVDTGYNTIEVRSATLGRVRCTAFVNLYLNK